jgi:hypothetical protein
VEKNSSAKQIFPRVWDAAVLVKDIEKTKKRMEASGIGQFIHPLPPAGAEGLFFQGRPLASNMRAFLMQVGNLQLEFIQPDDKPNPWSAFLQQKGEGIHHIGVQVQDVDQEVKRLTALGAEVPFYGKIKGKLGAAYVDLKVANLIIELTSFCFIEPDVPAKPALPRMWDTAVLVEDLVQTTRRLEALGFGPFFEPHLPAGAEGLFYKGQLLDSGSRSCLTRFGNLQLEFIQPDDQPNPWQDFLNTKGEGIHHIGFQVQDVEKEVKRLTGLGAEVPFIGKINGQIGAAYVDLKVANLFIELTSFNGIK